MTIEPLLFWEHGTLLQPQHFQINDRHLLETGQLCASLSSPYPWGVRSCELEDEALKTGQIVLRSLDVLLPGGEHAILGQNAVLAPKNCTAAWTSPDQPMDVFLGLPAWRMDAANTSIVASFSPSALDGAQTRFVALQDPAPRRESLAGGAEADVRFMYYNLKLVLAGEEDQARMPCLPVARLVREAGVIRQDPSFVPPCLDTAAFPLLAASLKNVRNALAARLSQLEALKLPAREARGSSGRTPLSLQTLSLHSMLQVLSRYTPLLEHYCETGHLHPWMLYGLLRQIVGELSLFSPDVSVLGRTGDGPALPAYNHLDPASCLAAASALVCRLVELLAAGPAHTLPMARSGHFWTCLVPDHARMGYDYWLQIRSEDRDFLASLERRGLRFAPEELLNDLLTRSLPGVPLTRQDPPAGIPRRTDTACLALDTGTPLWISIQATGRAALFLPQAPEDCSVQLVLMTPVLGQSAS